MPESAICDLVLFIGSQHAKSMEKKNFGTIEMVSKPHIYPGVFSSLKWRQIKILSVYTGKI